MPAKFFVEIYKFILKFLWKDNEIRIAKEIFKKKWEESIDLILRHNMAKLYHF